MTPRSSHGRSASRLKEAVQESSQPGSEPAPTPLPPLIAVLAEGEAVALPPNDETPNSAPAAPPTRVPHLGHALLFVAMTGLLLLLAQASLLGATHPLHIAQVQPKLILASEAFAYLATLGLSLLLFPMLWQRPFLYGLQWNGPAAKRNLLRLIPLGLLLSVIVQGLSELMPVPKQLPMDDFFRSSTDIWLLTIFGTLVAPVFEEILFRGFLLPAFAIAYDWLCLPRSDAARAAWQETNTLSRSSLIFSTVLTSVLFALLHGKQTAFTWPILALLFCVSLVLTTVRLRLRSVAASSLVHACYNLTVFLAAFAVTGGYRHLERLPH